MELLVTTEDILNFKYRKSSDEEVEKNRKKLFKTERIKLENSVFCPQIFIKKLGYNDEELVNLIFRLNNLNTKLLSKYKNQFYNPDAMKAIACVSKIITFSSTKDSLYKNLRIKKWLTKYIRIGSESAYGKAFSVSLKDLDSLFVIKVTRLEDKSENNSLIHEASVGILGTNKLIKYIPNFSYIYGLFECGAPIDDIIYSKRKSNEKCKEYLDTNSKKECISNERNDVLYFCGLYRKTIYIIYENINPSITLSDYIKSDQFNITEWMKIFMQIILALNFANEKIGFTHYDLHTDNVLIRNINNKKDQFLIKYPYNGDYLYLQDNKIATIIDYGMSRIKHEKDILSFIPYNISKEYYFDLFPLHDVYKILMFSSLLYYYKYKKINETFRFLFQFFNESEELTINLLEKQYIKRYSLPMNEKLKSIKIDVFIKYILENFQLSFLFNDPKDKNILECNSIDRSSDDSIITEQKNSDISHKILNSKCSSYNRIINDIFSLDKNIKIESFSQLRDIIIFYGKEDFIKKVKNNLIEYNYDEIIKKEKIKIEKNINKISQLIKLQNLNIKNLKLYDLENKRILQLYKDEVYSILKASNIIDNIFIIISSWKETNEILNFLENNDKEFIKEKSNELSILLEKVINEIKKKYKDFKYIRKLYHSVSKEELERYKNSWWFSDFKNIIGNMVKNSVFSIKKEL